MFARLLVLLLLCASTWAGAGEIPLSNPQLTVSDDGYTLSSDFSVELNPHLEEAVLHGVTLYFTVDFEAYRPRWYWFDERVVARTQTYRLYYHALTRQYRLSYGALHQSFPTLPDALHVLGRVRNWVVVERGDDKAFKVGETYQLALRMRLDLSQLPKPFQVSALGNRDWDMASEQARWLYTAPPLPPAGDGR
jgi:hypothetical protein